MGAIAAITAKDLRLRLRDRSVLMIAFVVPLGLAFVFNLLFSGLSEGSLGTVRVGVVDLDGGQVGQSFTDRYLPGVQGALQTDGTTLEVQALDDRARASDRVDAGELAAAVVVPEGASEALQEARPLAFEVVTSPDASLEGDVVASLADQFVQQARGQLAAQVLAERAQLSPDQARSLAGAVGGVQGRIRLDQSVVAGQGMDASTYLTAGMAVFFLFFSVGFGVLGYLEEQRDGTLDRLLSGPISRGQVLAAKVMVSLVVGVVATGALMLASVPMLGASWGNPVLVAVLVVVAVASATSRVGGGGGPLVMQT